MGNTLLIQKTYHAMGGQFTFSSYDIRKNENNIQNLFELAFVEIRRIEEKFTDHRPSYFNRINDKAGIQKVEIDDETLYLIDRSLSLHKQSAGLFDISFASIGHIWRNYQKEGKSIPENIVSQNRKYIDSNLIEVDRAQKTVFLPFPEMKIGLGGIGKGYAVDQAYNILRANNLSNFCINGSGDIRVYCNENAKRKWQIGIRNPFSVNENKAIGIIQLTNGAVATSGGYNNNIASNKEDHHIINPKTGHSRNEIIQSTIISDSAITSDTNATIVINQTIQEATEYLDDYKICGIFIDNKGQSHLSKMAHTFFNDLNN